jgi:hypothetical protein
MCYIKVPTKYRVYTYLRLYMCVHIDVYIPLCARILAHVICFDEVSIAKVRSADHWRSSSCDFLVSIVYSQLMQHWLRSGGSGLVCPSGFECEF